MTIQTSPVLATRLGSLALANPILVASGPWADQHLFAAAGAVVTKSVTLAARPGNSGIPVRPVDGGVLNRFGLKNPGLDQFLMDKLPWLQSAGSPVIVSVADDYEALAERLDGEPGVAGLEINISCPNVEGGILNDPQALTRLVERVRSRTSLPLWVKLSLHARDLGEMAAAAESAGADAISAINTVRGMNIQMSWQAGEPVVDRFMGGLSGLAIHPIALYAVHQIASRVQIPVIGMGGIHTLDHVLSFIAAGASAVQVGGACHHDPGLPATLVGQLQQTLESAQLADWQTLKERLWQQR